MGFLSIFDTDDTIYRGCVSFLGRLHLLGALLALYEQVL
jgi:hypothetical protein